MRKMIRWYLALVLLAAACILGAWAISSRSKEPTNATLVWNISDSREQNNPDLQELTIPAFPGRNIAADIGIQKSPGTEACRI